ncbi:protein mab-21-like 3 [Lissotriton helveticus]
MSAQAGGGWGRLDPGALQTFLRGRVLVSREDTARALQGALSQVEPILQQVRARDARFCSIVQRSGSHIEGLKVSEPNEFDFLVAVNGLPAPSVDTTWSSASSVVGVADPPPDSSFRAVMLGSMGARFIPLGPPATGMPSSAPCALMVPSDQYRWADVIGHSSLLLPEKVTNLLKTHVRDVTVSQAGSVTVRPLQMWTPNVTLMVTYYRKEISVNLVPLIKNPFVGWNIPWPRPGQSWPSPEKISEIQDTGVDLVAKHNLYWRYSFSRIERVLLEKIDEDGGRRRDSLRILKKVREDQWKTKFEKVLMSYHLKTLLFWACEENPSPSDWQDLTKSFARLVDYLVLYLQKGNLPHYFLGSDVNLFKPGHSSRLQELLSDVIKFRISPMSYLT